MTGKIRPGMYRILSGMSSRDVYFLLLCGSGGRDKSGVSQQVVDGSFVVLFVRCFLLLLFFVSGNLFVTADSERGCGTHALPAGVGK